MVRQYRPWDLAVVMTEFRRCYGHGGRRDPTVRAHTWFRVMDKEAFNLYNLLRMMARPKLRRVDEVGETVQLPAGRGDCWPGRGW